MLKILYGLTLAAFAFVAHTALSQEPAFEMPAMHTVPGEPVEFRWSDGRVARLEIGTLSQDLDLPVPFQVTENLCTFKSGQKCNFHAHLRRATIRVVWAQHPNPERIGRPVQVVMQHETRSATGEILTPEEIVEPTFDNDIGHSYDLKRPLSDPLHPDWIECDDYSWLPGSHDSGPPPSLHVLHWGGEAMNQNNETFRNENQFIGGAFDVRFTGREHPETPRLLLDSIGMRTNSGDLPLVNLLGGDQLSLFLLNEEKLGCQITLKPSLTAAMAEIEDYRSQKPEIYTSLLYSPRDEAQTRTLYSLKNYTFKLFNDKGREAK